MKTICITGAPGDHLDNVAEILRRAGMSEAQSNHRDDALSLQKWHELVLDDATEWPMLEHAIQRPGKLWEQLASAIYLPNLSSPLWGWADARSVWLLDFWMAFDPKLHFIFPIISSLDTLAAQLANSCGEYDEKLVSFPAIWLNHHQELLRFHRRHPQRTMLVDAAQCLAHPDALISACAERWKIKFSDPEILATVKPMIDPLSRYLAQQILMTQPQLQSLQKELDATALQFPMTEPFRPDVVDLPAALHSYLQHYTTVIAVANQTNENLGREIIKQSQLIAAETQQKIEAKKSLDLVSKKFADSESAHSISRTKCETLAIQLKDWEAKQIEAAAAASRDAQKALALTQKLNTAEATLKDVIQENELILLQLHQVQEELEHYFLLLQEAKKNALQEQSRRQRMLERMPAYMDFKSIEIQSVCEVDGAQEVSWHIASLDAGGRELPELLFRTRTGQDEFSFIFAPAQGSNAMSLLRWPSGHAPETALALTIGNKGVRSVAQIETLLNLSTSDYCLLKTLCRLLTGALAMPDEIMAPADLDIKGLKGALQSFLKTLEKPLVAFRFDHVNLKHEQTDPDYEHLWFEFHNISFGDKHWSRFECRLSCSNVQSNQFGGFPALEFPESAASPLESWRAEQHDAHGAKLAFCFALPSTVDMGTWTRFSVQDQRFIASLILQLPDILHTLQHSGMNIKRPWAAWMELAASMRTIMAKQVFAVRNNLNGLNTMTVQQTATVVPMSLPVDQQGKSKRLATVSNRAKQKEKRIAVVK